MHNTTTSIKPPTGGPTGSWYKLSSSEAFLNQRLLAAQQDATAEHVDREVESALHNGYDGRPPPNLAGHYYCYSPSSDLETIVEESSVLDSEDEVSLRGRHDHRTRNTNLHTHRRDSDWEGLARSSDSSYSSLSSSSTPRQSGSYFAYNGDPFPNGVTEGERNYKSDNAAFSPQEAIPKSQGNQQQRSRSHNEYAPVDPFAHQKIVYAKCLSLRPDEAATDSNVGDALIDVAPENGSTSGTISDMFDAARMGDVCALNIFSASELTDTVDERGNTPLHIAAENGHLSCIKRLISTSSPELITLPNDDLMTPTAMAIKNGHIDCVQWLVRHSAARDELSVSKRTSSFDGSSTRPPIAHVAARYNHNEILDWLCEEMDKDGYPVDTADHCSNTPVHVAARYGHLECIQTLVSRGASVTMLNSDGDTPGQAARKFDHGTCVGYLVVVETCVSLAQQLVGLRNDMDTLKAENEKLRHDSIRSPNMSLTSSPGQTTLKQSDAPGPGKLQTYAKMNGVSKVDGADSGGTDQRSAKLTKASSIQRRKLQEQPPPPKIWGQSNAKTTVKPQQSAFETPKTQVLSPPSENVSHDETSYESMQQKINAALNGPGTALDEPENHSERVSRDDHNTATNLTGVPYGRQQKSVNDEIDQLTKDLEPSTPKKPWEKLSMDEMLKMVRDMRYQPSPSISLCTEDSTMESADVLKERMAAASRWFLVERTRDKGSARQPATFPHGARTMDRRKTDMTSASKPRQRISVQPAVSWVPPARRPLNGQLANNRPQSAAHKTAAANGQQTLQQRIGNYYSKSNKSLPNGTNVNGATVQQQELDATERSGTLKFMVKNGKSSEHGSPQSEQAHSGAALRSPKAASPKSPKSKLSHDPYASHTFSAQRSGSYRRAVDKQQVAVETRSSSDSLSSGSSRNTARSKGHASDARSVDSSKSTRSAPAQSPLVASKNGGGANTDPLQKRTGKDATTGKRVTDAQARNRTADNSSLSAESGFTTIEKSPPTHKYQPPIKSVSVANPNRLPYFWSVPRGYSAQSYRKPPFQRSEEDDDQGGGLQPASEVPQLRAEIPSRQSSFLRKVQGKLR